MRVPTEAERKRAAERLAQLARMPGLEGGTVTFFGDDLDRLVWTRPWESFSSGFDSIEVRVPPASAYSSDEELMEACCWEISEAILNRGDQALHVLVAVYLDGVGSNYRKRARSELAWINDNVARVDWEKRLTEVGA
jgi:hypothetical protein